MNWLSYFKSSGPSDKLVCHNFVVPGPHFSGPGILEKWCEQSSDEEIEETPPQSTQATANLIINPNKLLLQQLKKHDQVQ
jgi:hypothetical protein